MAEVKAGTQTRVLCSHWPQVHERS